MNVVRVALLALSLFGFSTAWAEDLSPEKVADLRALFELTGTIRQVDQVLTLALQQMGPSLRNCKDCNERTAQIVELELRQIFRENFAAPGGLLERQIAIYHRHLTHDEVKQLLQFYRSPVGMKISQELPAITAEGYQAGREWMLSLTPELRRRVSAAIELDKMLNPPPAKPEAK